MGLDVVEGRYGAYMVDSLITVHPPFLRFAVQNHVSHGIGYCRILEFRRG